MSLLLGLFVSVFALTACGSDDDDEGAPESLAGTEWSWTTPKDYTCVVSFKSSSKAVLTVKAPDAKVEEETEYQYSYDPATGAGRAVADNDEIVTFVVTGNTLTCKVDGENMNFKRTK